MITKCVHKSYDSTVTHQHMMLSVSPSNVDKSIPVHRRRSQNIPGTRIRTLVMQKALIKDRSCWSSLGLQGSS